MYQPTEPNSDLPTYDLCKAPGNGCKNNFHVLMLLIEFSCLIASASISSTISNSRGLKSILALLFTLVETLLIFLH